VAEKKIDELQSAHASQGHLARSLRQQKSGIDPEKGQGVVNITAGKPTH
jgi:hypothetical protein